MAITKSTLAALDTIESVGVSIEQRQIAKARKYFDLWNLGLAGAVPVPVPYAYCSPGEWADPENDSEGWEHLTVTLTTTPATSARIATSSTALGRTPAAAALRFRAAARSWFGASGGYHTADAHESDDATVDQKLSTYFHNTAKNLEIYLEFGLVEVIRPWFMGDLFALKNYYLVNNKKNSISDGTIDGQAESQDNLLPMVPLQFLVVRNLRISSKDWGSDGQTMKQLFGEEGGAWDSSSSGFTAGASYGFGPFSVSANVSHDQAKEGVRRFGNHTSQERQDYEGHFDGETLEIKGAQIVAWLSTIVPPCPPMDAPKPAASTATAPATAAAATH